jgi:benzoate membrane transport protein
MLLYAGNAAVAFLFAASGPVAIILSVGARGGLSESDIASWVFAAFCLNSILSFAFSLRYRQPLVFLWSIPGAVLLGPALGHLSFPQVIGAFVATGVLMLLLGLSGWVRRAMESVPMPIVMAMVAGVFLRFGVDLVLAFRDDLWLALPMTAAFFTLSALPRLGRALPPLIGALVVGAIAVWWLGRFKAPAGALFALAAPNFYVPQFSWAAMVELVVPLAITVLVVQNGQGIAVLTAAGHRPPINAITAGCGVGAVVTGLFGAVPTCLTGPVNAILSSSGEKERHYVAALIFCLFALASGLHRHARRPRHAAHPAGRLPGVVRRALQLRGPGLLPGDRGRRAHLPHRRAVLGPGPGTGGGLASGAERGQIGPMDMKRALTVVVLAAWCGIGIAQDKSGVNEGNAKKAGSGFGGLLQGMGQEIGKVTNKDGKKASKKEEKK